MPTDGANPPEHSSDSLVLLTLVNVYGQLLALPVYTPWRMHNQAVYAKLVDDIARLSGVAPQNVQNFCEALNAARQRTEHA